MRLPVLRDLLRRRQKRFQRAAKGGWVDGRITVEPVANGLEGIPQARGTHEAPLNHFAYIGDVLGMPALDLGQRLRVEVVVVEGQAPMLFDEGASVFPARELRNEVRRGSELHVDLEGFLQGWNRPEESVGFRGQLEVDVDRALPPAYENRRGSSREVRAAVHVGFPPDRAHGSADG